MSWGKRIKERLTELVNYIGKIYIQRPGVFGAHSGVKIFLPLALIMAAGIAYSQAHCAVVLGNEVVAVAADRDSARAAVQDYFARVERITGAPVKVEGDAVKYRPTWRFRVDDQKEIQRRLAANLHCQYSATGIFVDGKMVAAVKDAAAGERVLDKLLNAYNNDGKWEASFKQKVVIKPVTVDGPELMEEGQALEHIRFGGEKVRTYQVKEGDTLWDVASAARLPVEDLLKANPGFQPETMQIGQEIMISRAAPLVDVVTTYRDVRREEVYARSQEKIDPNLYWGERKLVQQGAPGQREAVYQVTLENGMKTGEKVVQEKVIKEPKPQIVATGNKKLLAFRGGNGRLAYPASGAIVSPFGSRWGRTHEGVDIAAGYGSPVVAAEAGRIQSAGYNGGYGLCIDISHGNGVVTRYAHLSSTAVKPGQRVERGQFIGRAGSSGNSTGPHLHFEVMVNGVHKNPSLFI